MLNSLLKKIMGEKIRPAFRAKMLARNSFCIWNSNVYYFASFYRRLKKIIIDYFLTWEYRGTAGSPLPR